MEAALYLSALGLGIAGAPHCVVMCTAPCAAALGRRGISEQLAFHLARAVGYAAAGGLAAASVNALGALSSASPVFKPLWTLVHAAALALGIWLLWAGRQPAWLEQIGRSPAAARTPGAGGWQVINGPARSAAAGALWVAWPCGLLQSAVLVAALADSAWSGAAIMAVFAGASGVALVAGPWAWARLVGVGNPRWQAAGVRLAGAMLAAAATWVLARGLWSQVAAYCGF